MSMILAQTAGERTAEVVLFWVLSAVAVGGGLAVVTMRNVVHGALMLVASMGAIAGLFLLLQSPFLAVVQIIVYAGAIMVLFLFVLMLLGVARDDLLIERNRAARTAAWLLAAALAAAVAVTFVGPFTSPASVCGQAPPATEVVGTQAVPCAGLGAALAEGSSVAFVGERLYTRFVFAFELVGFVLLVAIVGALIVARRRDPAERFAVAALTDLDLPPPAPVPATTTGAVTGPPPHEHRARDDGEGR